MVKWQVHTPLTKVWAVKKGLQPQKGPEAKNMLLHLAIFLNPMWYIIRVPHFLEDEFTTGTETNFQAS